jgi:hypothetical protein
MSTRTSAVAHAAYLDLLRAMLDAQVADIQGTPRLERRGNRSYWYDMHRVGSEVRKRYLGEDTAEMADRIARHREIAEAAKAEEVERSRLIRLLRAEGAAMLDASTGSLLAAMAKVGTFRLGATLVGTQAFRFYELELGVRTTQTGTLPTNDIDIAQFERLSLALGDQVDGGLNDTFRDFDFAPVPSLHKASVWRWKQTRSQTLIEFLTPSFRAEEDIRPLPALGVSAQSLHYLNYLIAEPIKAAALYRSGVLLQIPRPERYAIHKLIVADRRQGTDRLKAVKDRGQAAFLIDVLAEDRPEDLREALADARSRGPRWGQRIDASLSRMPDTAGLLSRL